MLTLQMRKLREGLALAQGPLPSSSPRPGGPCRIGPVRDGRDGPTEQGQCGRRERFIPAIQVGIRQLMLTRRVCAEPPPCPS